MPDAYLPIEPSLTVIQSGFSPENQKSSNLKIDIETLHSKERTSNKPYMAYADQLSELLPTLETLVNADDDDLVVDEKTRERLYAAARRLMLRLEVDAETMQRIDLGPIQLGVIKLAYDVNLFGTLVEEEKMSLDDLSLYTGVDKDLLSRILKFCAAHGMISETGQDEYRANKMTRSFTIPGFKGAVISHHATTMRAAQAMPDFLAKTDYVTPNDPKNCILQMGIGCEDTFFEFLGNNPYLSDSFNDYMAAVRLSQKHLGKLFDFNSHWGNETDSETPLFVDVGGGSGHQCISLLKGMERKGRIILQDLPDIVEGLSIENVEVMPHDFFTQQPVKEAKVYYFRTILHDWPDEDCRVILKNIYDAMSPDSIILIDERVIADKDAHWIAMNMDLAMMLLLAARERSERQWVELLGSVGLQINEIHRYSNAGACLIEAVKAKN